jgi:hypothetical protein
MVYKAKVVLMSTDKKDEWFVYRMDYITEAETEYHKFEFSGGPLGEGDVLMLTQKAK